MESPGAWIESPGVWIESPGAWIESPGAWIESPGAWRWTRRPASSRPRRLRWGRGRAPTWASRRRCLQAERIYFDIIFLNYSILLSYIIIFLYIPSTFHHFIKVCLFRGRFTIVLQAKCPQCSFLHPSSSSLPSSFLSPPFPRNFDLPQGGPASPLGLVTAISAWPCPWGPFIRTNSIRCEPPPANRFSIIRWATLLLRLACGERWFIWSFIWYYTSIHSVHVYKYGWQVTWHL